MQHQKAYPQTLRINSPLAFGPAEPPRHHAAGRSEMLDDDYSNDREFQHEERDPFHVHPYGLNELEREELEFLARFIQGSAFYAESLEEYLGEPLEDFWEAREHAYHIVTTYLILDMHARKQCEHG